MDLWWLGLINTKHMYMTHHTCTCTYTDTLVTNNMLTITYKTIIAVSQKKFPTSRFACIYCYIYNKAVPAIRITRYPPETLITRFYFSVPITRNRDFQNFDWTFKSWIFLLTFFCGEWGCYEFLTLPSYGLTFQNLSKSAYWQNGYQYVWTF